MVKKGRLTLKEQQHRIKILLGFIFIFRYATRDQLIKFMQSIMKLSYQRRLLAYALKKGFISGYSEPVLVSKIYHLTQKGKEELRPYEVYSDYYRFDIRNTGLNTFEHQKAVVESYFLLYNHLELKEWIPEWVLRIDRSKRAKIPDGVMVLSSGIKIALEVETWYKRLGKWGVVVAKYRREISYVLPEYSRYHAVLIVSYSKFNYEGIKTRLFKIEPEFSLGVFLLTDLEMLIEDKCFYQNEVRGIEEALSLLRVYKEKMEKKYEKKPIVEKSTL